MRLRRPMLILLFLALGAMATACATPPPPTPPSTPNEVALSYDFRDGTHGWEAGFVEYHRDMEMQLESGLRPLPSELGIDGTGFYLQGMNRSDDLFMYLTKGLTTDDGIMPGQSYRAAFRLVFASNAPSGAVGIGGAPGESVSFKAGVAPARPEPYLDDNDYWMLNVDKGGGNSGEGDAATIVGTIENGLPAEEIDFQNPPYVSLERSHEHSYVVTASDDGELWLMVGTDSGFEGLTGIYYQQIHVTLQPVS
jgi:hypothetical protein